MEFGLLIMHPLFTSSFRKNILQLLIIIAFPAIVILIYVEVGLNKLDTHYLKKSEDLKSQANNIQILSLGSSNAYFGLNPREYSCLGFNLAFNAQSMYYDMEIIKKYIDTMPKLRIVVLPAIFYTTGTRLVGTSQDWRMYFYKQYWGLPLELESNSINENIKRLINSKNYSKIALYSDTIYTHIRDGFSGHVDYIPDKNGWYDSKDLPRLTDLIKVNSKGAFSHSLTFNESYADSNIVYWQQIISILKAKKIEILIVRLPEDVSYYSQLDQKKAQLFTTKISELAKNYDVNFADYSQDKRFVTDDFTLMNDHLNQDGATKFSKILNKEHLFENCIN